MRDAIEIKRADAADAERLRELRLTTMRDAPYAFSSWYERERRRPDEFWQRLASESEHGSSGATFVAVDEGDWIGLAGVFADDVDRSCVCVWGMWVAPHVRRSGVGRRLICAIRGWAVEHGMETLRLSVSDSELSEPARLFYESLGFVATGEVEAMASDPSLRACVMTLALG